MKKVALVLFSFALVLSMVFPAHAQAPKFPDVPKNYWAYEQIRYVSNLGWMSGKPDGKFYPNEPVTRGQFALLMYTYARKKFDFYVDYFKDDPLVNEEDKIWRDFPSNFSDVDPNSKLGKAVGLLAHYKIANGYPDGTFRPNEPITRGQVAVIMSRFYWGSEEANRLARIQQHYPLPFQDPIPASQRGYIYHVYNYGWMGGTSKTTFGAEKKVTRAQAAVIMFNLDNRQIEATFWKDGNMFTAPYF